MDNYSTLAIGNNTAFILLVIFIVIIVFFLIREILLWYWKVNKIVGLLEKIEQNTRPRASNTTQAAVDLNTPKPVIK